MRKTNIIRLIIGLCCSVLFVLGAIEFYRAYLETDLVENAQKPKQKFQGESPYKWVALREKDRIKLKAFVPSDRDRKTILGFAQANLPNVEIIDKMKVAYGIPSHDIWLGGVSFGLKQASLLRKGRIQLNDTNLEMQGVAKDAKSYELLHHRVSNDLPRGITIAKMTIRPPKVRPYMWSIKIEDKKVVISGFVPNKTSHNTILSYVAKALPNLSIIDGMSFASGTPKHWEQVVRLISEQFLALKDCEIIVRDETVKISGTVSDHKIAQNIKKLAISKLPKNFNFDNDIKVEHTKSIKRKAKHALNIKEVSMH